MSTSYQSLLLIKNRQVFIFLPLIFSELYRDSTWMIITNTKILSSQLFSNFSAKVACSEICNTSQTVSWAGLFKAGLR